MTRSNRQLTQFAVNKVLKLLENGPAASGPEKAGNTKVFYHRCENCPRSAIRVSLFDNLIMEVVVSPFKPRSIAGLLIKTGDFYDSKGRPSRTTRERLNGLLDALGEAQCIPEGVRVFFQDDGSCFIGKGETRQRFDQSNSVLGILSHPREVVFA